MARRACLRRRSSAPSFCQRQLQRSPGSTNGKRRGSPCGHWRSQRCQENAVAQERQSERWQATERTGCLEGSAAGDQEHPQAQPCMGQRASTEKAARKAKKARCATIPSGAFEGWFARFSLRPEVRAGRGASCFVWGTWCGFGSLEGQEADGATALGAVCGGGAGARAGMVPIRSGIAWHQEDEALPPAAALLEHCGWPGIRRSGSIARGGGKADASSGHGRENISSGIINLPPS